jgi:hypothetical protein
MKILAATPQQYKDTIYIAELNSSELAAILAVGHYDDLPVTSATEHIHMRKRNELLAGDVVETKSITAAADDIRELRNQRSEIAKAFSTLRGAITKVENKIHPIN